MRNGDRNGIGNLTALDTASLPEDGGEEFNRLVFEKSPYLLQHARNPVAWYPWGEEAFRVARDEDRPVLLSIGYSTCHWCHVMEEESFEDEEVAAILNAHFVAIKVDREERPDIDNAYMAVCQMMTGSGGWPLNLVLTPEKKPFFAATYLPKTSRGGMVGLCELLRKVAELWRSDRERLVRSGDEVGRALLAMEEQRPSPKSALDAQILHQACNQYRETFDRHHAGFATPKFPSPHNLSLLLRIWQRTGEEQTREMALRTLRNIRLGGIYDHIGFGVHRYAVDAAWRVPHFEKMLYDQALAALAFLDAYQVTRDAFYGQTAVEILDYVTRDLSHPQGGFYCGEDADSEGAEGTFYLWRRREVLSILGKETGTVFCRAYGITEEGNFEGKNIPFLEEDLDSLARRAGVAGEELSSLLASARKQLFRARKERPRPHRDDKIITSWNGLAVAALARTGAVLEKPAYIAQAEKTVDFILARMRRRDGRLQRRYRDGETAIPGFHEDYAFFVWGLVELHQATFATRYLELALEFSDSLENLFDDANGGYFDTGADAETVLARGRSLQDGAIPAAASVTALNQLRLACLTGRREFEERGERLLRTALGTVEKYPTAFAQLLIALDFALGPTCQAVIATADGRGPPRRMLHSLRSRFLPRHLALLLHADDRTLPLLAPLAAGKAPPVAGTCVYLCRNKSCQAPLTEAEELDRILDEQASAPDAKEAGR